MSNALGQSSGQWSRPWSKSIDNSSGIRNQGFDTLFPQDNRCRRCDRALSSFDTRHRFVAFNVFNHPSWGAPSRNIRAGAAFAGAPSNAARQGFGVISSTAIPMRQLQVALKYSF
jgi:hypothetical protein